MRTGTEKSAGRAARTALMAASPPADAATRTMAYSRSGPAPAPFRWSASGSMAIPSTAIESSDRVLGMSHWQHRYGRISCTESASGAGQRQGCDAVKAGGPVRVMVVDDHPVFAQALALAIEATGELTCVGTALDIDEAAELADEFQPEVAVVDVQLDGTDGITGTRRLLDRHPGMQVLVLTGLPLSASLVHDVAKSGRRRGSSPSRPASARSSTRSPPSGSTASPSNADASSHSVRRSSRRSPPAEAVAPPS